MAGVHALVLGAVALAWEGVRLGGSVPSTMASAAILLFGLPHGAFDVALIRRGRAGHRLSHILMVYIGVGASMAALWLAGPTLALAAFLAIAVAHFAEDWAAMDAPFLANGTALALVASPALLHRAEVASIFVALAGTARAAGLADILLLAAPVGLAVAAAGIVALAAARRFDTAAALFTSLAATIAFPPTIGFAVFFCLFHSPRHFACAVDALALHRARQWLPVALPTLLGAGGLVALIYMFAVPPSTASGLTSATFMALSILTLPHMAVPAILAALRDRQLVRDNPATPKKCHSSLFENGSSSV